MRNIYGIESLVNAFENSLASSYYSQLKDLGTTGSKYIHYTSKIDNDTLTCAFELPGYGIEDINLDVEPGYITISSEKENNNRVRHNSPYNCIQRQATSSRCTPLQCPQRVETLNLPHEAHLLSQVRSGCQSGTQAPPYRDLV